MKQMISGAGQPLLAPTRREEVWRTNVQLPSAKQAVLVLLLLVVLIFAVYNGWQTEFQDPVRPGPRIVTFSTEPIDGRINLGQYAVIKWDISDCAAPCKVHLEARDGDNYSNLVSSLQGLPSKGSMRVMPTRSTLTEYVLAAQNAVGTDSQTRFVELICGTPCSTAASSKVFYFKLQKAVTESEPCFTIAIDAEDAQAAQHMVDGFDGGYSPVRISESDFLSEC